MQPNHLIIVLMITVGNVSSQTNYSTMANNYASLLSMYSLFADSTNLIPKADLSSAMTVTAELSLFAISDYDEVSGSIDLETALELQWGDEILQIVYGETTPYTTIYTVTTPLTSLVVPSTAIWTPNIVLNTAVGTSTQLQLQNNSFKCRYNLTSGRVTWRPRLSINSACSPDVTFYPVDRQVCTLSFTPWGYDNAEVAFVVVSSVWDLSSFEESGEWNVMETSSSTSVLIDGQSVVYFEIVIERKPLYFAFNIIFPVLLLCVLNGMVFWLPVDSGERVGFSVTCFLSFVVLLNMIMDILPRSSSPMSYLCYYLVIMMMISGVVTAVVMIQIRLYHKPEKEEIPRWLRHAIRLITFKCRRNHSKDGIDEESVVSTNVNTVSFGIQKRKKISVAPEKVYPGYPLKKSKDIKIKKAIEQKFDKHEEEEDEKLSWKHVVNFLDKFFYLLFLGTEIFFSFCFLVPLFHRA